MRLLYFPTLGSDVVDSLAYLLFCGQLMDVLKWWMKLSDAAHVSSHHAGNGTDLVRCCSLPPAQLRCACGSSPEPSSRVLFRTG